MTEHNFPVPDDMPWVNLTQEEIDNLRKSKKELTDYAREKLRNLMKKEPIAAKISTEDYNKVLNALNLEELDEREKVERCEKSNRVLERYNRFYNMECSGLAHGTPITPEFQQAMTLKCMLDALRCENLNHEFDVVSTDDINALIEGLYQQGKESLKKWEEFKDSADGVA